MATTSDPLLVTCRWFSLLSAAVGLLCVFVNVLSATHSFRNGSDVFGGIFRCYAVPIAAVVAAAETEQRFIFKFCRVLEYWVGRGMLQIFVAAMTRAFPDLDGPKHLVVLQSIASFLLLACGLIYIISGFLCLGLLKRARQRKETRIKRSLRSRGNGEERTRIGGKAD